MLLIHHNHLAAASETGLLQFATTSGFIRLLGAKILKKIVKEVSILTIVRCQEDTEQHNGVAILRSFSRSKCKPKWACVLLDQDLE